MKKVLHHIRSRILGGLLAVIPVAISVLAITFLYISIDRKIMGALQAKVGHDLPGLGIVLLLLSLYVLGLIAGNVLGRQVLHFLDRIFNRIPLIKTVYHVGKQLSSTLSLPEKQVVKRVVLVSFPKPGVWSIGFVTGVMKDNETGEDLLRILVPISPNPASGFLFLVREQETRETGWSVEDAVRFVISDGLIGPDAFPVSSLKALKESKGSKREPQT